MKKIYKPDESYQRILKLIEIERNAHNIIVKVIAHIIRHRELKRWCKKYKL